VPNELISKYLIKGQFYTIITFIIFAKKRWFRDGFNKKLLKWAIFFLLIILLSDTIHFDLNPNFINHVYYIFLFFLILYLPKNKSFESNLLSLIIAIGLLQVIVSFLQVNQIIAPPRKIMEASTYFYQWEASLFDAASGTIGAAASNVTSWMETILFLTFFISSSKVVLIHISLDYD